MNFVDDALIEKQLFPFTLTRSIADIRIGILTIREKWLLAGLDETIDVPSHLLPSFRVLASLRAGNPVAEEEGAIFISRPWHIFQYNGEAIRQDFAFLSANRLSQPISNTNQVICPENIFLEAGAHVEYCVLNASGGPVYIGKNAEIMEGCFIRGPFALCEGGTVKMGSTIYAATTIGPYSVVGGEIKNSVIFGFSNKGHHGYLGDSVIGEWCNLGAGTTNSNVKNTAGEVKIWNPQTNDYTPAGHKCGLFMGDYSRSAINTSFNTGTVTGVCCNIFGDGLTSSYIPSFSWGGNDYQRYDLEKAFRDINNWKKLKNHTLSEEEIKRLEQIFKNL